VGYGRALVGRKFLARLVVVLDEIANDVKKVRATTPTFFRAGDGLVSRRSITGDRQLLDQGTLNTIYGVADYLLPTGADRNSPSYRRVPSRRELFNATLVKTSLAGPRYPHSRLLAQRRG
jgi:hypothetical protein